MNLGILIVSIIYLRMNICVGFPISDSMHFHQKVLYWKLLGFRKTNYFLIHFKIQSLHNRKSVTYDLVFKYCKNARANFISRPLLLLLPYFVVNERKCNFSKCTFLSSQESLYLLPQTLELPNISRRIWLRTYLFHTCIV